MTFVLVLDTSSRTFAVAVGGGAVPAAQRRSAWREDPAFAGLGDLAARTLADAGAAFADVGAIGVDVGPGGLSSIRGAVAYANGLAFSLGVRVFPVSSLELMAIAARGAHRDPVLCVKRGQGGNVYAGLFADGETTELSYGSPEAVVPALVGDLDRVALAGAATDDAAALLPGVTVVDTGIVDADVTVLYQATRTAIAHPERLVDAATPLNEASRVFHDSAAR